MRKTLIIVLLFALLTVPVGTVFAENRDRSELLGELQALLQQLIAIQTQLIQTRESGVAGVQTMHLLPSRYYQGTYEALYAVNGGTLSPYGKTVSASSDFELWGLLKDVMGESVIRSYITEFRVYNDAKAEFDAFVEQIDETDDWIFGVNLASAGFESDFREEIAIELFVHEYAHILHHYNFSVAQVFEDRFWGSRSNNKRDFVSDYAMESSEEDFAESFMYFVLEPRPYGSSEADKKVRFFYNYDFFRDIREDIRDRLYD